MIVGGYFKPEHCKFWWNFEFNRYCDWCRGFSSYGTDLVFQEYCGFSTRRVNHYCLISFIFMWFSSGICKAVETLSHFKQYSVFDKDFIDIFAPGFWPNIGILVSFTMRILPHPPEIYVVEERHFQFLSWTICIMYIMYNSVLTKNNRYRSWPLGPIQYKDVLPVY